MSATKTVSPIQRREIFWIDVLDHMPDDEITVLVCCANDDMWLAYHSDNTWKNQAYNDPLDDVTHWADLPEPPEA